MGQLVLGVNLPKASHQTSSVDRCFRQVCGTGNEGSVYRCVVRVTRARAVLACYLPGIFTELELFAEIIVKGAPSIPETYLLSSVAWGLNLRVG